VQPAGSTGVTRFVGARDEKSDHMQVLRARGKPAHRGRRIALLVLGVVVVVAVIGGIAYSVGKKSTPSSSSSHGAAVTSTTKPARDVAALKVTATSPTAGATNVASNATITVQFSAPVALGSAMPTLAPPVAGTWAQLNSRTLEYRLTAPLIPSTNEVLTIPSGKTGLRGRNGSALPAAATVNFTVADGSIQRLQEVLAALNYMPLTFTPSGPAPAAQDLAQPQAGSFAFRWQTLYTLMNSLWTPGSEDVITKGAVESFQNQNGLTVDGLAGPAVWSALLNDLAAQKMDPAPYVYVLVSKTLPENLTLFNNGMPQYANIPVNTGAPGADTVDGTYPVFEHVPSSRMTGTNPDGSTYDDPAVPWASYFNGGDALHGFVRASYGSPQSNGCVEMAISDAQTLWPLTPIGTLVTVVGPPSG
jgi:peptidoglycan hydrolase-like protein with peptidoglycan-binding domain